MTNFQTRFNIYLEKDINGPKERVELHFFDSSGAPDLSILGPYMPRIRWQLWFKFLSDNFYAPWYKQFLLELLSGKAQLPSIIKKYPGSTTPYNTVILCYEKISFNLNAQYDGTPWKSLSQPVDVIRLLKMT